jgi:hypothetical protein
VLENLMDAGIDGGLNASVLRLEVDEVHCCLLLKAIGNWR